MVTSNTAYVKEGLNIINRPEGVTYYMFHDTRYQTVDQWNSALTEQLDYHIESRKPVYLLFNCTEIRTASVYMVRSSERLVAHYGDHVTATIAIVFDPKASPLLNMLLQHLFRNLKTQWRTFYTVEDAANWLKTQKIRSISHS